MNCGTPNIKLERSNSLCTIGVCYETNNRQSRIFIFLLEKYAEAKGVPAKDALNLWKEKEIVDYINGMYEQYHTERIENAIQDIERKCQRS